MSKYLLPKSLTREWQNVKISVKGIDVDKFVLCCLTTSGFEDFLTPDYSFLVVQNWWQIIHCRDSFRRSYVFPVCKFV